MEYTKKLTISQKVKNSGMIAVCIIGSISLLGLVMAFYSIFKAKFLFTFVYLIAVLFGFLYVVMRLNTILPTFIASSEKYLYIRNWKNFLFPFRTDKGFIGEFLPEKTTLKKIDISAIDKIYIGTRNYLLKLVSEGDFHNILASSDKKYASMLKKMDFLYISTYDGRTIYMCVNDYDSQELAQLLKPVVDKYERIDFRCNDRVICKIIPPKRITLQR